MRRNEQVDVGDVVLVVLEDVVPRLVVRVASEHDAAAPCAVEDYVGAAVIVLISLVRRGNEFLRRRENVKPITTSGAIAPLVVVLTTGTGVERQAPRVLVGVGVAELLVELPVLRSRGACIAGSD